MYLIIQLASLVVAAPFVGWLADVRFGRYEIIKIGTLISFFTSILFYFNGERSTVLNTIALTVIFISSVSFTAAMLLLTLSFSLLYCVHTGM